MKNTFNLENLFVLLMLIFGTSFAILVPPNEVPDEGSHFARVYGIVNGNFTINRVRIPEGMNVLLSKYSNFFSKGSKLDIDLYFKDFSVVEKNLNSVEFYPAASYAPVLYLPQAIGLGLGELLKMSELGKFVLGRLFSVLLYTIIGYFILRTMSFAKRSFFVVLLMPMSVYLAASYSADAMQIMLTFLYISMVIFELNSQTLITLLRKVAFIVVGLLLSLTKPVSLVIILLSCAIPLNRFKNRKDKFIFVSAQLGLGILFGFAWTKLISSNLNPSGYLPWQISPAKQLAFVLLNPFAFIKTIIATTNQSFDFFLRSFVGDFGWLTTVLPEFVYFIFAVVLCLALFRDTRDRFVLTKSQKYIFLVVFLLYFMAVMISMYLFWTPVGKDVVLGVQGRYFIPVFPVLFYLIASSLNGEKYVWHWLLTGIIVVLVPVILALSLQTIYLKFYVPCGEYFYDVNGICILPVDLPAEKPIEEITKPVTQTFTSECNDIAGVDLLFATYARQNSGSLNISLRDETTHTLVFEEDVNVAKLKDNKWVSFRFPFIQNVSGNKFSLTLLPQGSAPGNAVTVWSTASDIYTQGELHGMEGSGDLVFRYICRYGVVNEIRNIYNNK